MASDQIRRLIQFGPLFEEKRRGSELAYRNPDTDKEDDSEELRLAVSTWEHLADNPCLLRDGKEEEEEEGGTYEWMDHCLHYYVNDANQFATPQELRTRLLAVTSWNGVQGPIVVRYCVLVAEHLTLPAKIKQLRFFYVCPADMSVDQFQAALLNKMADIVQKVVLAKKEDGSHAYYGFAAFQPNADPSQLLHKQFDFDGIRLMFD